MWPPPPPLLNSRRGSVSLICTPQVSGYEAVGRKRDHDSLNNMKVIFWTKRQLQPCAATPAQHGTAGPPHLWELALGGSCLLVPASGQATKTGNLVFLTGLSWKRNSFCHGKSWAACSSTRFSDQAGLLKRSSCCFPAGTGLNYSADRPAVLHWSWCLGNVFKAAALLGK